MDYIQANTSQVLTDCLLVIQSPKHSSYLITQQQPVLSPDIQYFQNIKSQNHFSYHKFKTSSKYEANESSLNVETLFSPLSHINLMARLKTYNLMNWLVPLKLDELKCARNGWKCTKNKNNLLCVGCGSQLVLYFEDEDDEEFEELLIQRYVKQVISEAHSDNCLWRNFETPLEAYYSRPYMNDTNVELIGDYLENLKSLIDNGVILGEFGGDVVEQNTAIDILSKGNEIPINGENLQLTSNQWLLARYFKSNKENFSVLLEFTPPWFYRLALLGWSLNVQRYEEELILLLICSKCNQRLFLSNETKFDPFDHKPWCCTINKMVSSEEVSYAHYFTKLLIGSGANIGPDGEYVHIEDDAIGGRINFKRRESFDIEDGLDRLSKLRRVYLG